MSTPNAAALQAGGFTLVEILVSMTLLSVASLALGSMLFRTTRQAGATSVGSQQTAELASEVSRLGALPFSQLAVGTTCVALSTLPGTRCLTVNNISSKVKQVTVVITPSSNPLLHPITTTFTRTISGNGNGSNPLKTP